MPFSKPRPMSEFMGRPGSGNAVTTVDLIRSMCAGTEELDPDTCWRCPGDTRGLGGYGRVNYRGRLVSGHRLAFAFWWLLGDPDEIPTEVAGRAVNIDHVAERGCVFKDCVNPWHLNLEFVDRNILLGNGPAAQNARKEVCLRRHILAGDNLIPDPRGGRGSCRRCDRTSCGISDYFRLHHKDVASSIRSRVVAEVHRRLVPLAEPSGKSWRTDAYALAPVVLAEIEAITPTA